MEPNEKTTQEAASCPCENGNVSVNENKSEKCECGCGCECGCNSKETKYFRVIFNGMEIKNPVINFLVGCSVILLLLTLLSFIISVVLPFIGTVVSFALGVAGVMLIAVIIGLVLLLFASPLIALIAFPFVITIRENKKNAATKNQPVKTC